MYALNAYMGAFDSCFYLLNAVDNACKNHRIVGIGENKTKRFIHQKIYVNVLIFIWPRCACAKHSGNRRASRYRLRPAT